MKRTQRKYLKHYERYIKLLLQIEKEAESVDVIEEHLDHLLQLIEPEFEHPRVVYGLILLDDKSPGTIWMLDCRLSRKQQREVICSVSIL